MESNRLLRIRLHFPVTAGCIAIVAAAFLGGCGEGPLPLAQVELSVLSSSIKPTPVSAISSAAQTPSASSVAALPTRLLDVPFAPQAPFGVWDPLHEEACEEMSLVMVHFFRAGRPLSLDDADAAVRQVVDWERERRFADDVTVAQVGEAASALYGYRARILTDVTADTLRREIALGNPVIVPAVGRSLGNPYFNGTAPFYHMLVVVGYEEGGFITNDPGTKRGARYWYATDVLMNALHDWTGNIDTVASGAKNALVIER